METVSYVNKLYIKYLGSGVRFIGSYLYLLFSTSAFVWKFPHAFFFLSSPSLLQWRRLCQIPWRRTPLLAITSSAASCRQSSPSPRPDPQPSASLSPCSARAASLDSDLMTEPLSFQSNTSMPMENRLTLWFQLRIQMEMEVSWVSRFCGRGGEDGCW